MHKDSNYILIPIRRIREPGQLHNVIDMAKEVSNMCSDYFYENEIERPCNMSITCSSIGIMVANPPEELKTLLSLRFM